MKKANACTFRKKYELQPADAKQKGRVQISGKKTLKFISRLKQNDLKTTPNPHFKKS